MRSEYERWLREAEYDFETACILHREKRYNAAAFYAQQAAEKAVKALLYKFNEAPWDRSIRVLLMRFKEISGMDVSEELFNCDRELDRHYIPSRYPNAHSAGTAFEAYDEVTSQRALECARKIIDFVREVVHGRRTTSRG